MRIYLDNCTFNRPFDDQTVLRIRLESEAKLWIQGQVRAGGLELIWSHILDYENAANPFSERKRAIGRWKRYAKKDVIAGGRKILSMARNYTRMGLRGKDALHLACAVAGRADYFLSTDDNLIKAAQRQNAITVCNPVDFIRKVSQ